MKKIFFLLCILSLGSVLFAQDDKTLAIITPDTENIEESWLAGVVVGRFSNNFSRYTNYTLVDYGNVKKITDLQKKSGLAAYSEESALEVGKLQTAKYALFSTIRKTRTGYILSCDLTDLETGQRKTAQAPERKTIEELYNMPGCSVDRIFLSLCDSLSIALTPSQRYEIEHGDKNLTYEEQVKKAKEDEALFAKQLEELDNQILTLKTSADASATAQAAKLEAQRVLAEQKRFAALQNAKRLEEEAKLRQKDEAEEANRSAEQKKRRDEMAKEAERKANEVRQSILKNSSIYSQITIIEAKKRAVVDIRANVNAEVAESTSVLEKEMNEKVLEKENAPYRRVDRDAQGNPVPEAVALREKEIEELKTDYRKRILLETANIEATPKAQENSLLAEINSDYKELAKNHIVSSLTPDLKYSMQAYDGARNGWDITLYLYSEGIPLLEKNILLKYSDLTGKKIPKRSDKEAYEAYGDEIDLYDSLFGRGEPIIMFEADLSAVPRTAASEYAFNFGNIYVKATDTGAVLATEKLGASKFMKFTPAYDIRSKEEIAAAEKAEQKRQQKKEQEEYLRQVEEQRKQLAAEVAEQKRIVAEEHAEVRRQKREARRLLQQNYMTCLQLGGGLSIPLDLTKKSTDDSSSSSDTKTKLKTGFAFDAAFSYGVWDYFFLQVSGGLTGTPTSLKDIFGQKFVGDAFFSLGANFTFFYFTIGGGALLGKTDGPWIDSKKQKEYTMAAYFAMKYSLGINLAFSKFGVYAQMNIVQPIKHSINMDVVVGVSFHPFN